MVFISALRVFVFVRVGGDVDLGQLRRGDLGLGALVILDGIAEHEGELGLGGTALGFGDVEELAEKILREADGDGVGLFHGKYSFGK
jgi:hypothetical protein